MAGDMVVRPAGAWLALVAASTAGCLTGSSTTPTYSATLITVDPQAFLGSVVCGVELQTYVVSLIDVTDAGSPDAGLPLTSTGPVPCTQQISFNAWGDQKILVGHFYIAVVDGYDRTDIAPTAAGQREMYVDGQRVYPRWSTTCGQVPPTVPAGDAGADISLESASAANPLTFPIQARLQTDVFLRGCMPFTSSFTPDAAIDVVPSEAAPVQPDGGADATDDGLTTADSASSDP
jgi:hypothetical protein